MTFYVVDISVFIQYAITETYTPHVKVLVARLGVGDQICLPEFGTGFAE